MRDTDTEEVRTVADVARPRRPITVGSPGANSATTAAVATALALIPIVPHLVEDAAADAFTSIGLSAQGGALLAGIALAVQFLAAYGTIRGRRSGYVGVVVLAAVWIVAAVFDHPGAFTPGEFRTGLSSRFAVWGLVGLQAVAALAAFSALRSTKRTSFAGTGSFSG